MNPPQGPAPRTSVPCKSTRRGTIREQLDNFLFRLGNTPRELTNESNDSRSSTGFLDITSDSVRKQLQDIYERKRILREKLEGLEQQEKDLNERLSILSSRSCQQSSLESDDQMSSKDRNETLKKTPLEGSQYTKTQEKQNFMEQENTSGSKKVEQTKYNNPNILDGRKNSNLNNHVEQINPIIPKLSNEVIDKNNINNNTNTNTNININLINNSMWPLYECSEFIAQNSPRPEAVHIPFIVNSDNENNGGAKPKPISDICKCDLIENLKTLDNICLGGYEGESNEVIIEEELGPVPEVNGSPTRRDRSASLGARRASNIDRFPFGLPRTRTGHTNKLASSIHTIGKISNNISSKLNGVGSCKCESERAKNLSTEIKSSPDHPEEEKTLDIYGYFKKYTPNGTAFTAGYRQFRLVRSKGQGKLVWAKPGEELPSGGLLVANVDRCLTFGAFLRTNGEGTESKPFPRTQSQYGIVIYTTTKCIFIDFISKGNLNKWVGVLRELGVQVIS